jgi:hypothetical protein
MSDGSAKTKASAAAGNHGHLRHRREHHRRQLVGLILPIFSDAVSQTVCAILYDTAPYLRTDLHRRETRRAIKARLSYLLDGVESSEIAGWGGAFTCGDLATLAARHAVFSRSVAEYQQELRDLASAEVVPYHHNQPFHETSGAYSTQHQRGARDTNDASSADVDASCVSFSGTLRTVGDATLGPEDGSAADGAVPAPQQPPSLPHVPHPPRRPTARLASPLGASPSPKRNYDGTAFDLMKSVSSVDGLVTAPPTLYQRAFASGPSLLEAPGRPTLRTTNDHLSPFSRTVRGAAQPPPAPPPTQRQLFDAYFEAFAATLNRRSSSSVSSVVQHSGSISFAREGSTVGAMVGPSGGGMRPPSASMGRGGSRPSSAVADRSITISNEVGAVAYHASTARARSQHAGGSMSVSAASVSRRGESVSFASPAPLRPQQRGVQLPSLAAAASSSRPMKLGSAALVGAADPTTAGYGPTPFYYGGGQRPTSANSDTDEGRRRSSAVRRDLTNSKKRRESVHAAAGGPLALTHRFAPSARAPLPWHAIGARTHVRSTGNQRHFTNGTAAQEAPVNGPAGAAAAVAIAAGGAADGARFPTGVLSPLLARYLVACGIDANRVRRRYPFEVSWTWDRFL